MYSLVLRQVRVTAGDSGLCCCVCVTSFERRLSPFFVDLAMRRRMLLLWKCALPNGIIAGSSSSSIIAILVVLEARVGWVKRQIQIGVV